MKTALGSRRGTYVAGANRGRGVLPRSSHRSRRLVRPPPRHSYLLRPTPYASGSPDRRARTGRLALSRPVGEDEALGGCRRWRRPASALSGADVWPRATTFARSRPHRGAGCVDHVHLHVVLTLGRWTRTWCVLTAVESVSARLGRDFHSSSAHGLDTSSRPSCWHLCSTLDRLARRFIGLPVHRHAVHGDNSMKLRRPTSPGTR